MFFGLTLGGMILNASASEEPSFIYIKAINPGYTVDGRQNVGEMIELARRDKDSNDPISLAGLKIGYTNSSGNTVDLLVFPQNSWMTGENLILQLASSTNSELAHISYLKTIAQKAGPLELILDGEIIDSVCWTGADGCYDSFKSTTPTTLVRDDDTLLFSHLESYEPTFKFDNYFEVQDETPSRQCEKIQFSEILSYYEDYQSEQFIELYNPTSEKKLLDGCFLRYKNKNYPLTGIIDAESYFVRFLNDFSLTKNPTISNLIEIIDTDDSVVASLTYFNNQKKATSYARIGYKEDGEEDWRSTYKSTPGSENIFQEFRQCEAGKVINKTTGNCVKITEIVEKICKDGYYLNPETGRCRKIAQEEEKKCQDGYVLNPLTNRCKKVVINDGDDYPLVPNTYATESSFIALNAIIVIIVIGILYIVFQFRQELLSLVRKVFRRSP